MNPQPTLTLDGRQVPLNGDRNLLELARRAGVEIPTFCYHSELSIYGACRLCLVDVEGRGIVAACSTPPEAGMTVRTRTDEIRSIRRLTIELLLASGNHDCPTCPKNGSCRLQDLARRLGVRQVRFPRRDRCHPLDECSPALVRDPNKCILCGDCVRACDEIQGVGAVDFAWRGADAAVVPAFGKPLGEVECVHCGQCARVCPTGSLTPKPAIEPVMQALNDPETAVVAQLAPAVRVALGEHFGAKPGEEVAGKIVAALRRLGFDQVFDTAFTADLTVIEEAAEFAGRLRRGERLPQFTSCCPAWVQYAEQYCPGLLPNLSTCRSPQQMFGALAKEYLPEMLGTAPANLKVVSLMPCTAKKAEAVRAGFAAEDAADVDFVLTTQELARMIEEAGFQFDELEEEAFDLPFGFKTGAGVIFGASGGVSEAVLRHVQVGAQGAPEPVAWQDDPNLPGVRWAGVLLDGREVRVAAVYGLANAKRLCEAAQAGECAYDLVEVMACPGGCVGGAGQPVTLERDAVRRRAAGLFGDDRRMQLHNSGENFMVKDLYRERLGEVGGANAHRLLHTEFQSRRRTPSNGLAVNEAPAERLIVGVCLATNCYLRGAQGLLTDLMHFVEREGMLDRVEVRATFCLEQCENGPSVTVGGRRILHCGLADAEQAIREALEGENVSTCRQACAETAGYCDGGCA